MKDAATPTRTQEIASHTALRGVAAVLVVIFHYRGRLTPAVDLDAATGFFSAGFAFVDLFFILSGFIMSAVYAHEFQSGATFPGIRSFLAARIARIYPLHLVTIVVMVAVTVELGTPLSALTTDIATNAAMVHAWGVSDRFVLNFPSWSISGEWAAYLLFPLLAVMIAMTSARILMIAFVAAAYCWLAIVGGGLNADESLSLLRAIPGFVLGMLLFRARGVIRALAPTALAATQLAIVVCLVAVMHFNLFDMLLVPLFAALTLSTWTDEGPVGALFAAGPLRRAFAAVGAWSYAIYMLHVPFRACADLIRVRMPFHPGAAEGAAIFFVICFFGVLISSAIVYRWFEMPARRRLRQALS